MYGGATEALLNELRGRRWLVEFGKWLREAVIIVGVSRQPRVDFRRQGSHSFVIVLTSQTTDEIVC